MLTALDQIANQNHLQIFKTVIPYIPQTQQRFLSLTIKMLELQNVTRYFRQQGSTMQACSQPEPHSVSLPELINEMKTYCDDSETKLIDQMSNLLSTIEMLSVLSETMNEEVEHEEE